MTSPDLTLAEAVARGPVVLDGGLATDLERAGHDLSDDLWSARLLRDDPDAIREAHARFLAAGAQVVISAGYQASVEGFVAAGADRGEAERLVGRSVALAREAVAAQDAPAWVAASVGPYGAVLAGGQEYTGEYVDGPDGLTVDQLRAWHRPRLELLAAAGADVLAVETVPALAEVEALAAEVDRLGIPAWISITAIAERDGVVRTAHGERASEAFAIAASVPAIIATGINCCDPVLVADAVADVSAHGLPAVTYPNSGETWDGYARRWTGDSRRAVAEAPQWVAAGARLVGGCCRVGPEDIAALSERLASPGHRRPAARA